MHKNNGMFTSRSATKPALTLNTNAQLMPMDLATGGNDDRGTLDAGNATPTLLARATQVQQHRMHSLLVRAPLQVRQWERLLVLRQALWCTTRRTK